MVRHQDALKTKRIAERQYRLFSSTFQKWELRIEMVMTRELDEIPTVKKYFRSVKSHVMTNYVFGATMTLRFRNSGEKPSTCQVVNRWLTLRPSNPLRDLNQLWVLGDSVFGCKVNLCIVGLYGVFHILNQVKRSRRVKFSGFICGNYPWAQVSYSSKVMLLRRYDSE